MNIIECTNLTKEYLSGDSVVKAVDNVTVAFEQGEFCAITGPSGSGKSTFLHVLSSLENATSGYVTYGDQRLSDYNDNQLSILRRRRFGFVFQAYNLVQELTGYENILLPIMLDRKKPDENYLDKIIKMLGIEDRLEHLPSALSGGQQQRIAIARALANKPSILFADEPTGNLDGKSGREVLSLLKYAARELGITLILVTHDLHVAEQADRILTLEDGRIVNDSKNPTTEVNSNEEEKTDDQ
ncbi:MAG: ABC transporter ATP-binding protein [Eubacterium sp.]|nr:ABC transporter ATP-binding protein [Eubacterium sp.]